MFCKDCRTKRNFGVSGQGFTKFKCNKCGQLGFWHNTDIPGFCQTCSTGNFICADCGKDLIVEVIEDLKREKSLYDISLDAGISESSLYKYLKTGSVGPRVYKKLRHFVEEYYEARRYSHEF